MRPIEWTLIQPCRVSTRRGVWTSKEKPGVCPQEKGPVSTRRPQEKPNLLSDSSLWNREKTSVYCLSYPIGGILLWQPEQTNTIMLHERSQTQRVRPRVIPSGELSRIGGPTEPDGDEQWWGRWGEEGQRSWCQDFFSEG